MAQIKINDIGLFKTFDSTWQMSLLVDDKSLTTAQKAVDNAKERLTSGKDVGIEVDRLKKPRSMNANAYFHVLCDKIAEKLGSTLDEVKTQLVVTYGTPLYSVTVPKSANIGEFWRYYRWIGETDDGKKTYLLYKQTHTLDTKEMARLIDGTVSDAKALDIETMTPQQLAEMKIQWENEYGKCD